MAKIIKSKSKLFKSYQRMKKINMLSIITLIASILIMPQFEAAIFLCLLSVSILVLLNKKTQILKAGVHGEKVATKLFKKNLSNEYTIFHDLTVTFAGKPSQIDHVIVGPSGVFIVETKNINGDVTGSIADNQWNIMKTGRKGGTYSKNMYNATKQVSTHVYRLSNFLRQKKIHTWVQGIVYFSNEESSVLIEQISKDNIPVFSAKNNGKRKLIDYIHSNETELSKAKQEKAVNVLKSFCS